MLDLQCTLLYSSGGRTPDKKNFCSLMQMHAVLNKLLT